MDGRVMEAVNEYASTCDGPCAEFYHHEHLTIDPKTKLAYCDECIPKLPRDVKARVQKVFDETYKTSKGPA